MKRLKRTHYIINNAVMSSGTHIVVFVCTVAFACSHSTGGLVCFYQITLLPSMQRPQ